jgi:hypothetical protein
MMKRIIVILFMLLAAADLLQASASSSKPDSASTLGPDGAVFFTPGIDSKTLEDKMAEALVRLDSWKVEHAKLSGSPSANSTLNNISISNSSLLNSSAENVDDANKDRLNVGSSSNGSFNGYYGMTASRHEIGKSGIDSHMFLKGTFEMDKAVKFQDRGI